MLPSLQTIQDVFSQAPEHLQEYIKSDEMYKAFYAIRDAYKLHVDHAGNLALAIDAVILGLNEFTDLPALLAEGLQGVDAETQTNVVRDVNDKIFVPLREKTKRIAEEMRKKSDEERKAETLARPEIRTVEASLLTKEPAPVLPTQAPSQPLVAEAQKSIIEQKMTAPSAPAVSVNPVSPQIEVHAPKVVAEQPAPRYHGTDPYREPAE